MRNGGRVHEFRGCVLSADCSRSRIRAGFAFPDLCHSNYAVRAARCAPSIGTPTTVMTATSARGRMRSRSASRGTLAPLSLQLLLFKAGAAAGALGEQHFGLVALAVPMLLLALTTGQAR